MVQSWGGNNNSPVAIESKFESTDVPEMSSYRPGQIISPILWKILKKEGPLKVQWIIQVFRKDPGQNTPTRELLLGCDKV